MMEVDDAELNTYNIEEYFVYQLFYQLFNYLWSNDE
jgi:hypothetical protein